MNLIQWARRFDGLIPRRAIAAAANSLIRLRGNDRRRFSVDRQGRWVNRQAEATFVSPDIFTAHFAQVQAAVLDNWCQYHTPGAGDQVIDIGAGIGEDAIVFSKLVGRAGRVIAVEAHPETFACLEQTIARSGAVNVVPVYCAIAERDGTLTIDDTKNHLANALVGHGQGIEVPAKTIDTLVAELGIERIDLLKMNIEGAERPAMLGMERSAAVTRHAAISCHDFVADVGGGDWFRTRAAVESALEGFDFVIHRRASAPHPWLRDTLYGERAA